jgi:hypothetical protein
MYFEKLTKILAFGIGGCVVWAFDPVRQILGLAMNPN